ncbi:MAG: sugar ABC transporter permease [Firmicutes bacterium]|nr:sugar ABC transporter permease [Bacillota bacterium]
MKPTRRIAVKPAAGAPRERTNRWLNAFTRNGKAWMIVLPSVLLFYFIMWRPIAEGVFLSFFKLENYQAAGFVGFQNYREVLSDTLFLGALKNTFGYVFWSLLISFLPPIIIAVALNEMVHLKGLFKFSIYFPVIVPTVAAALIWYFLYLPGDGGILNMLRHSIGLKNSEWLQNPILTIPLIITSMTWRGCGTSMVLYLAALQGVNQELYEASTIDGAGFFLKLRYITFPHLSPIILLLLVRQIVGIFQVMVEPMTMTGGGPNNASLSLNLQGYNYAFVYFQPERALALNVITFVILLGITVFYFRLDKKLSI